MDFYRKRMNCFRLIDEEYRAGKTEDQIMFKVQTAFGFGKKIVRERIELIERVTSK